MINKDRWIIGVTGASGIIYLSRLIKQLILFKINVNIVFTKAAILTVKLEYNINLKNNDMIIFLSNILKHDSIDIDIDTLKRFINSYHYNDFSADIASGSSLYKGIIIVPSTINILGKAASCIADDLLSRAITVAFKEKRKILFVVRETPLPLSALKAMVTISEMGGIIMPTSAGMYLLREKDHLCDYVIDFLIYKILDHMEINNNAIRRW